MKKVTKVPKGNLSSRQQSNPLYDQRPLNEVLGSPNTYGPARSPTYEEAYNVSPSIQNIDPNVPIHNAYSPISPYQQEPNPVYYANIPPPPICPPPPTYPPHPSVYPADPIPNPYAQDFYPPPPNFLSTFDEPSRPVEHQQSENLYVSSDAKQLHLPDFQQEVHEIKENAYPAAHPIENLSNIKNDPGAEKSLKSDFHIKEEKLESKNEVNFPITLPRKDYDEIGREIIIGVDSEEYPKTISKFWIKIENMKKLYPYNQNFQANVGKLETEKFIVAWKRSRGDGNCYFRAVISKFFDIICKPYEDVKKLKNFAHLLETTKLDKVGFEEFDKAAECILEEVKKIIKKKEEKKDIEAYQDVLNLSQNQEFDINLVKVSRMLTAFTLLKEKDSDDIFPFVIDGVEEFLYEILKMGKEGGDLTLMILPKILNVQVIQYMFLEKAEMTLQMFPHEASNDTIKISIVRRSGHYDILYDIQEMELDACCLDMGTFNFYEDEEFYKQLLGAVRA